MILGLIISPCYRPIFKSIARCQHVAEKLSGLSETLGKEASCGDDPLPLW